MKVVAGIPSLALIASACSGVSVSEESTFSVPASELTSVAISNVSGDIVFRGSAGEDVSVHVSKRGPEGQLDAVTVEARETDEQLVLDVDYPTGLSNVSVTYTVEAPAGLSVEMRSSSGDILIEDYVGIVDVTTSSGDVVVRDVDGETHASSSSGDVAVTYTRPLQAIADPVNIDEILEKWTYSSVETLEGGDRSVSYPDLTGEGQRIFRSSSGNVTLSMADDLDVTMFIQAVSKKVRSDLDLRSLSDDGVRHTASANAGEGPLVILATAGGDIEIRVGTTE